ncbi:unnamed protein product [Staurois parvus]|uniref:Ribosomal protein S19 n=1 Tax=Staurois parvus TaxID=386267 RepID=A0ABN9G6V1_9NEOB|nr:unnamed protein product [Staurois parvus]
MLKKTNNNIKKYNQNLNTFWPRLMKKDYLFVKSYKKNTFFFKMFGLFHLYSKKNKNPSGE